MVVDVVEVVDVNSVVADDPVVGVVVPGSVVPKPVVGIDVLELSSVVPLVDGEVSVVVTSSLHAAETTHASATSFQCEFCKVFFHMLLDATRAGGGGKTSASEDKNLRPRSALRPHHRAGADKLQALARAPTPPHRA